MKEPGAKKDLNYTFSFNACFPVTRGCPPLPRPQPAPWKKAQWQQTMELDVRVEKRRKLRSLFDPGSGSGWDFPEYFSSGLMPSSSNEKILPECYFTVKKLPIGDTEWGYKY